jgi:hypothetical protein
LWLVNIAPRIDAFVKETTQRANVNYQSLYAYFSHIIQYGGDTCEFHISLKDSDAVAFASWHVMALPYVGTVHFDYIYSWGRDRKATSALVGEFIEFGKRNRCKMYEGVAINQRLFKGLGYELGKINGSYQIKKTDQVNFIFNKGEKK